VTKETLLDTASRLPARITSKEDLGLVSRSVVDMRDAGARAEATRVAEKEPHLRSGQAVDAFFKTNISDPLAKKQAELNRRINDYQQEQLAAERRRRLEEEREANRIAEEARLKAERARKEETKAAAQIDAALATRRAEEAKEATQATPAGMVRERFEEGQLVTMKKIRFAEVTNLAEVDLIALRPYIKMSAIEDAVKRWAQATEYRAEMKGVTVGERDEAVVR
jgi:hypothetical protein